MTRLVDSFQEQIDEFDDNYIVIFFDTAEEIYGGVSAYERQGLAWKSFFHKNTFMTQAREKFGELKAEVTKRTKWQESNLEEK